ncbi:transposase, partial [Rhodopirellula sp. JC639]|uniref:transposase n=1 Tax=Stieleria mannarensis TaxID=2755585 RepID=UPI0016044DD6
QSCKASISAVGMMWGNALFSAQGDWEMIAKLIQQMAHKAPAATLFRGLLERTLSDESLDEIFNDYREHQLQSKILFSHLVNMLAPVITRASKSVNAAHQAAEHGYSRQALYDKLKGVESPVASALLRVSTEKLTKIRKATKTTHRDVIKGFHTFVIDGKTYNATEHRLIESRSDARAPLPGRAIALLDMRHEMFVDVECDVNAYRCERKIAERLLQRQLLPGALYIADRNFSDGNLLECFFAKQSFFIIRQHGACPSWREIAGEKRFSAGKDSDGQKVYEQRIEVQLPDGSWKMVRRITVKLSTPARDGDKELHLLTNLPTRVRAGRISTAYRRRWTIENCFGHLSRALNAEIRALCYPQAAGLCFSLALLLFNVMSCVRMLLLKHGQYSKRYEISDVSYYYIADEISRSQFVMDELVASRQWKVFASMSLAEFTRFLRSTAAHASLARYRKHVRGPTKPKPKRRFTGSRHVSTQKILEARK